MSNEIKKRAKVFEVKFFAFIIGVILFGIFFMIYQYTTTSDWLRGKMLDIHFNFKDVTATETIQENVQTQAANPNISDDIIIVGIDYKSLTELGKWPFPRSIEANLLKNLARIKDQTKRESAVFLDIFFIEPDRKPYDDVNLLDAIKENGRVFLETVFDSEPPIKSQESEIYGRQNILYESFGKIKNIYGDWKALPPYLGVQPPLKPYGQATYAYGHANAQADSDGVFRRMGLVAKTTELVDIIRFDNLSSETVINEDEFERLVWIDRFGEHNLVEYPLTDNYLEKLKTALEAEAPLMKVDSDKDGEYDDEYYIIRKYRDHFVPAITLSLAINYFNKDIDDIEVRLGEYIYIPSPQVYDPQSDSLVPYSKVVEPAKYEDETLVAEEVREVIEEIKIPIDEQGNMLVNFMGASSAITQTYKVRSLVGYVKRIPGNDPSKWPRTRAVENKMLLVGPYAEGMAADEKTTPFGLMYGVEIHANALNTILMSNFILNAPAWLDMVILLGLVMLIAFISSRISTLFSLFISLLSIIILFFTVQIIFVSQALVIHFALDALAIIFTFISIVVYRVMTEEKDKRRIREMFGKYVSPQVVSQMIDTPPELGGVDKELTVFFSDIRGFTTLSETMTPQELVNHLNVYLTSMTNIILEYKGTLDKYVGDEIMCFWGAPLEQQDHALLACKCALKQMAALNELNSGWPPEKRIDIGIGVNSGIMTVGNMGSQGRMNYTLMGDNVNLGARLEGTNKQYKTNIIISEYTYGLVKDKIIARELDNIRVKGKNKPVLIYELIDCIEDY